MVEFIAVLALVGKFSSMRGLPVPWLLPVAAYVLGFVGHIFLEQNRSSTLVYPSYTLLCDFFVWSDTLRGKLPLMENLPADT